MPFILLATAGAVQALPDSLTMSCAAARRAVQGLGAVVIASGPSVYDRFVSSRVYCESNETTEPTWIATKDQPQCLVGQRCREIDIKTR